VSALTLRLDDRASAYLTLSMRILLGGICCVLLVAGCAKTKLHSPKETVQPGNPVITPDFRPEGKVKKVNESARYAIVNFPVTNLPQINSRLSVYRNGMKTGELKVTGPEPKDGNIAADILTGSIQVGDEAKAQ
jgi:hypothetical protein